MTRDMYIHGVNVNLTQMNKLNFFKELKHRIKQKNNKRIKNEPNQQIRVLNN